MWNLALKGFLRMTLRIDREETERKMFRERKIETETDRQAKTEINRDWVKV